MPEDIELTPEELALLKENVGPMPVIKLVYNRTRCGVRTAKEAVERAGRRMKLYKEGPCPNCQGTGRAQVWAGIHK